MGLTVGDSLILLSSSPFLSPSLLQYLLRRTLRTPLAYESAMPDHSPTPMAKAKLKAIDRPLDRDHVLRELVATAERFVNKAPKQHRLAADRQALLESLTHAQLPLSVSKP